MRLDTSTLKARIIALIHAQGPISVAQFMTLALHDPKNGYYATRDPIGAAGDFITAPEINQMFGEMLALWMAQAWTDQGCPSNPMLVELGPGRGTLMADMLRTLQLVPDFLHALEVTLIETSPALQAIQKQKLKDAPALLCWAHQFDAIATTKNKGGPLFVIANEFFDALPVRQYVRTPRGWCERMVTANQDKLAFMLAPTPMPSRFVPENRASAPEGSIYETAPAALALAEDIAEKVANFGGAALFIDYGYDDILAANNGGFGETLQAVGNHAFADVLAEPGEDDISAHVDFAALAEAGKRGGASVHGPVSQGTLLANLGIAARAEKLISANPDTASQIYDALERLIAPQKMGTLFKALAFLPPAAAVAPGFNS
jgi:NADH dehydrogenase [ubiquinone] 1 alpha subcomplex assembly factor 7